MSMTAAAAAFEGYPLCVYCGHPMPRERIEPLCSACATQAAFQRAQQAELVRSFGGLKLRMLLRSDWPAVTEKPLRWLIAAQPPSHEAMMNRPKPATVPAWDVAISMAVEATIQRLNGGLL